MTQIIPQIPSVLNNLLIIRLRNLGDCVLMTPVLEILKNWHPSLEITVLVEKSFVSVFSGNPHIARLIVLNRSRNPISTYWSRWEVMKALRGESYDLVWNLHGGSTSLMLALSPQSRMILGFEHYRNSNRYTHRVPAASSIFNKPVVHTVETQLAPLLWLGIPVTHEMMKLQVQVSRNASILVDAFLDRHKLTNKPFILVQPTATLESKQWPEACFAELIDLLRRKWALEVLLAVGPGERRIAHRVLRKLRTPVALFDQRSLEELKALMARAAFYIGNDSGPMHLAAALGRPLVAIFGSSNFQAWYPWGADYEAVRADLPCIPCPGYRCYEFEASRCIESISVGQVFQAFQRLIERHAYA